tara:strand:- start:32 stop:547 length:516 start_codon:yes stop_codon:yes gene_type:complete
MATCFNTDIGFDGEPNMTHEMIEDFKKWSRALGGEGIEEGVEPDLKNYINLGFCRNTFIQDMESSHIGAYEKPEYTYEEWEKAKIDEVKNWRIQAKHADHFYHKAERLREERDLAKNRLKSIELKQLLGVKTHKKKNEKTLTGIATNLINDKYGYKESKDIWGDSAWEGIV